MFSHKSSSTGKIVLGAAVMAGIGLAQMRAAPADASSLGTFTLYPSPGNEQVIASPDSMTTGSSYVLQVTALDSSAGYYGGMYIAPIGTPTFADLTTLSAAYQMTEATIGAGAPRFSIGDTTNNAKNEIYVYWGTNQGGGTFTDPNSGAWGTTGNYINAASNDLRFQINGFGGSSVNSNTYLTYSQVLADVGNVDIGWISLDLDGGTSIGQDQQMITDYFTVGTATSSATYDAAPVPEPATWGLLAVGGAGLLLLGRKRKANA